MFCGVAHYGQTAAGIRFVLDNLDNNAPKLRIYSGSVNKWVLNRQKGGTNCFSEFLQGGIDMV